MTTTIKGEFITRLLNDVLDRIPEKTRGTYNPQDPTSFSKGRKQFEYNGCVAEVKYHDYTWSTSIEVSLIQNGTIAFATIEYSPEFLDGVCRVEKSDTASIGVLKILKHLKDNYDVVFEKTEEYHRGLVDDPMGTLGDYI